MLDQELVEVLRRHRVTQSAERLRAGGLWEDRGFVFTTELGRTIAPATLLRTWGRLLAAAGIERVPFHTARHTAATLMLAAGVSPRVARERLGHATVSITLDRYSHVTDAAHREAAHGVRRLLGGSR